MNISIIKTSIIIALTLTLIPGFAKAQSFQLIPGEKSVYNINKETFSANLLFNTSKSSSYSCTLKDTNALKSGLKRNISFSIGERSDPFKIINTSYMTPSLLTAEACLLDLSGRCTPISTDSAFDRVSFITHSRKEVDDFSINQRINFKVNSDKEVETEIFCEETTLYGSYNTFIANFNFLELTNLGNQPIEAKYEIISSQGATLNITDFTLSPNSRKDFDLHSVVGPLQYGSVRVSYIGPKGSIKAKTSTYKLLPDSSMQKMSERVLTTR